ncbi:hypothetical protein ACFQ69_34980 [Streptomyces sp. NPDC056470]|uniref:hypothetical protein n=1 Tax=Streptomyces sp. NPDC056470 TaxID=3345831 RepID=UPI0036C10BCB
MTIRRILGPGPRPAPIQATEADLLAELPGVRLPDLTELRGRGVLSSHPASAPSPRRILGDGVDTATE